MAAAIPISRTNMSQMISRRSFVAAGAAGTLAIPAALHLALASSATALAAEPNPSRADQTAQPWSGGFKTLETEQDYWVEEVDGQIPPALTGTLFRNGPARNEVNGQWFP